MKTYMCAFFCMALAMQSIFADQLPTINSAQQLQNQLNAIDALEHELVQAIRQEQVAAQEKKSRFKKRSLLALLLLLGITITISFGWSSYKAWREHERDMQQIREKIAHAYAQQCACAHVIGVGEQIVLAEQEAHAGAEKLLHMVAQIEEKLEERVACCVAQSRKARDVIQASYQSTNQHLEQVIIPSLQVDAAKLDAQAQAIAAVCQKYVCDTDAQKNAVIARAQAQDLTVRLACARNSQSADDARQECALIAATMTQTEELLKKFSERIDALHTKYRNPMAEKMQQLQPTWFKVCDWASENENTYNLAGGVQKVAGFFSSFVPLFRVVDELTGEGRDPGFQDDYQSRNNERDLARRLADLQRQGNGQRYPIA